MLMEITPGVMADPTTGAAAAGYIGDKLDLEEASSFASVASNALKDYLDSDPDMLKDASKLSLEALNMYFEVSSKLGLFSLIPDLIIELGLAATGGPVAAGIGIGILMLGPVIVPSVLKIMKTNDPITAGEIMFQLVQDAIDAGFIDIEDIRNLSSNSFGMGALKEQRAGDEEDGKSEGWFGTEKCFIDTQFPEGHPSREVCDSISASELIVETGFIPVLSIVLFFALVGGSCLWLSTKGGPDPIKCGTKFIEFIKSTFGKLKDFLKPFFEKCKPLFDKAKALFKKGSDDAVDIPKINQRDTENLQGFQKDSIDAFRKDKNIPAPDLSLLDDALEYDNYISRIKHLDDSVSTSNVIEVLEDNLAIVDSHIADLRKLQLVDHSDVRVEEAIEVAKEVKSNLLNKIATKRM